MGFEGQKYPLKLSLVKLVLLESINKISLEHTDGIRMI